MTIDLLILLLVGFMLIAGLIAVETSDLLSAVIAIGAAGMALCVIDLLLGAPDLAFPQVVLEVVTLVLLVRMIMTREDTSRQTARDTLRTAVVLLVGGILLVTAWLAMFTGKATMPHFGESVVDRGAATSQPVGLASANGAPAGLQPVSAAYLKETKAKTGADNYVLGVLMNYRAYDALGGAAIIFTAVLGGFVVLRKAGRKKEGEA